jgi:hypothetical protein
MVTTDDEGGADTDSMSITVNAVNDLPTTSTPDAQSGTEDTVFTGYATSDFPFADVDGDSITSITITVVESSGTLQKSADGSSWTDVVANDVILTANIQHLKLTPALNSNAAVTFTYTVQDATGGTDSAVMTTNFAAVNDVPTWTTEAADVSGNEDTAITVGANVIADVESTSLASMIISSTQSGTFTLGAGIGDLTFAAGDGTADNTMTFSGTIAHINTAINSMTWTSAADSNTDAVLTLVANDASGNSATNSITITVNAVNEGVAEVAPVSVCEVPADTVHA